MSFGFVNLELKSRKESNKHFGGIKEFKFGDTDSDRNPSSCPSYMVWGTGFGFIDCFIF